MLSMLVVLIPVILLLLAGIVCDRVHLFPPAGAAVLNQFVFNVSMPCLVFMATALCAPEDLAQGPYLIGTLGISFVCYFVVAAVLSRGFRTEGAHSSLLGLLGCFSNAAFLGLPILMEFMPGNQEVVLAATIIVVVTTAPILVAMITLEWCSNTEQLSRQKLLKKVTLSLLKNPILIACILGALFSLMRWKVPAPFLKFLRMTSATAVPCALVAQGMVLSFQMRHAAGGASRIGAQSLVLVTKLLIMPALTWWALAAMNVDPVWIVAGVVLAAMPTGTLAYVISETYRVGERDCSQIIVIGTGLSMLTVPLLLYIMEKTVLAGL